jgi:hypothetical protein
MLPERRISRRTLKRSRGNRKTGKLACNIYPWVGGRFRPLGAVVLVFFAALMPESRPDSVLRYSR